VSEEAEIEEESPISHDEVVVEPLSVPRMTFSNYTNGDLIKKKRYRTNILVWIM
jgi:hypothetical protein